MSHDQLVNVCLSLCKAVTLGQFELFKAPRCQFLLDLVLCSALGRGINRLEILLTVANDVVGLAELSVSDSVKQVSVTIKKIDHSFEQT